MSDAWAHYHSESALLLARLYAERDALDYYDENTEGMW